jgi:hypothetical protein
MADSSDSVSMGEPSAESSAYTDISCEYHQAACMRSAKEIHEEDDDHHISYVSQGTLF